MIKAVNNYNGVESSFTEEQWIKVQDNPRYTGMFSVIGGAAKKAKEIPAEIQELKANNQGGAAAPEVSEKADKKTTQDKKQDNK